ncbi:MAG: hypothetical protein IJI49_03855 [Bacilli bacterium]|nr:hypothetical protein [Bacilli bacterium]
MEIDIESLRNDLKNDSLGAFYGGGFGGALIESFQIEKATPEELIKIADKMNINIEDYIVYDNNKRRR